MAGAALGDSGLRFAWQAWRVALMGLGWLFVTHHLQHTPSLTHTHTSLSHNHIIVTHHL